MIEKLLALLEPNIRKFWESQFDTGKASLIGNYIFHDKGTFRIVYEDSVVCFVKES